MPLAFSRGTSEARRDVRRGIFAVKSCGYPVSPFWRYQQVLEREYGIHAINLGCDPSVRNYVAGYNEVSERAIADRYGTNFLATVWERAKTELRKERENHR